MALRFQHYGAPTEADGLFYNFDFENARVVVPDKAIHHIAPVWPTAQIPVVTASDAGYPQSLVNFSALHLSPRFGLAFRINDRTVIRAGYGIYHVPFAQAGANASQLGRAGWLGDRELRAFHWVGVVWTQRNYQRCANVDIRESFSSHR